MHVSCVLRLWIIATQVSQSTAVAHDTIAVKKSFNNLGMHAHLITEVYCIRFISLNPEALQIQ